MNFYNQSKEELRALAAASTGVVAWHPHAGGDSYGPEATVRGPFFRWLKVLPVQEQYKHNVAEDVNDAKFAAAAMNNLVPLLDEIDALQARVKELEDAEQARIEDEAGEDL